MSAFRIFFSTQTSYLRQAQILICLLAAGLAEAFGLATIMPVIAVATGESMGKQPEFATHMIAFLSSHGVPVTFGPLLALMLAGLCLREILNFVAMTFVGYTIADLSTAYRWRLIEAYLNARWEYFTREPLGQLTHAVSAFASGAADAFLNSARFIAVLLRTLVYLVVIVIISGNIAFMALGAGVVIMVALNFLVGIARKTARKQAITSQLLSINLTDTFSSIKPLKAMARQDHVHVVFANTIRRLKRLIRRQVLSSQGLVNLQSLLETLVLGAGLYVAVAFWDIHLMELAVVAALMLQIMKSVGRIQRTGQTVAVSEVYFWRVRELIADAEAAREEMMGTATPHLRDSITFDSVTFSYGAKRILEDVSLDIPANRLTVIHGPSGQGKTTLADLVLGLYRPESGRILVDGMPLDTIDLRKWRSMVGYVPQDLILHNGSIMMNITLGDPSLREEDVLDALKMADAADFVAELDHGIHTEIGEKGLRLSGGQRQRISLARALVHKPRLIILDEVTSALDPATERAICDQIHGLAHDRTIISITHRAAWLDAADVVLELANHKVKVVRLDRAVA
jgi:ATP-binding cassette subfamily C protein